MNHLNHPPKSLEPYSQIVENDDNIYSVFKSSFSGGGSRAFQTLPIYLRRRSMSHNIHRLPRHLIKNAQSEYKDVKLPQSIRKKVNKPKDYLSRQKNKMWLSNHIWLAKRFKMKSVWGYRLPWQNTRKIQRPLYKWVKHNGAILHNLSYFQLYSTRKIHKLINILKNHSITPISLEKNHSTWPLFVSPKGSFLGWITLIKSFDASYFLQFHPCLKPFLDSLFTNFDITDVTDKFDVLWIRGPQTWNKITQVFQIHNMYSFGNNQDISSSAIQPIDDVVYCRVSLGNQRTENKNLCISSLHSKHSTCVVQLSKTSNPPKVKSRCLAIEDWVIDSLDDSSTQQPDVPKTSTSPSTFAQPGNTKQSCRVFTITFLPSNDGFQGVSILLPRNWSPSTWIKFTKCSTYPVSILDIHYLVSREMTTSFFPFEFPETDSGQSYLLEQLSLNSLKHLSQPLGKQKQLHFGPFQISSLEEEGQHQQQQHQQQQFDSKNIPTNVIHNQVQEQSTSNTARKKRSKPDFNSETISVARTWSHFLKLISAKDPLFIPIKVFVPKGVVGDWSPIFRVENQNQSLSNNSTSKDTQKKPSIQIIGTLFQSGFSFTHKMIVGLGIIQIPRSTAISFSNLHHLKNYLDKGIQLFAHQKNSDELIFLKVAHDICEM